MGSQPQKPQKIFSHILSCRDFYAGHFGKKTFFISSTDDGAIVKIQKTLNDSNSVTFFSILTIVPSFIDEIKKVFFTKMISVKISTRWVMSKYFWRILCFCGWLFMFEMWVSITQNGYIRASYDIVCFVARNLFYKILYTALQTR
jgi:hypothetical protein